MNVEPNVDRVIIYNLFILSVTYYQNDNVQNEKRIGIINYIEH